MRPEDVEMIATPSPPRTFGRLSFFAYTRRPGFDTRLIPAIERSRVGPNFRSTTSFLPTSASSTCQAEMYPSCWRISAICALIFEYGIPTVSWYAEFALRRRVSMSAIGSVIVMAYRPSLATVSLSDLWRGHGPLHEVSGGYFLSPPPP